MVDQVSHFIEPMSFVDREPFSVTLKDMPAFGFLTQFEPIPDFRCLTPLPKLGRIFLQKGITRDIAEQLVEVRNEESSIPLVFEREPYRVVGIQKEDDAFLITIKPVGEALSMHPDGEILARFKNGILPQVDIYEPGRRLSFTFHEKNAMCATGVEEREQVRQTNRYYRSSRIRIGFYAMDRKQPLQIEAVDELDLRVTGAVGPLVMCSRMTVGYSGDGSRKGPFVYDINVGSEVLQGYGGSLNDVVPSMNPPLHLYRSADGFRDGDVSGILSKETSGKLPRPRIDEAVWNGVIEPGDLSWEPSYPLKILTASLLKDKFGGSCLPEFQTFLYHHTHHAYDDIVDAFE